MIEPHIVRDFYIGATRIKIADNYCVADEAEVEQILTRIAERAQRQITAASIRNDNDKTNDKNDGNIRSDDNCLVACNGD